MSIQLPVVLDSQSLDLLVLLVHQPLLHVLLDVPPTDFTLSQLQLEPPLLHLVLLVELEHYLVSTQPMQPPVPPDIIYLD